MQDTKVRIVSYDQQQLAVAKKKLRLNPYACLHINITKNLINKGMEEKFLTLQRFLIKIS